MDPYETVAHGVMSCSLSSLEQEGALAHYGILSLERLPSLTLQPSSATIHHLEQLYNIITHL